MHPDTYAARKGLMGSGQNRGYHFDQNTIHEGYEINMTSKRPDEDVFCLRIEFHDFEERGNTVIDTGSLNLCFPPGYEATTGAYVSQSANLTEQMAGTKHSFKDEHTDTPTAKRRIPDSGLSAKNIGAARSPRKTTAMDSTTGTSKPVIIDLSGEEEYPANTMQPPTPVMKRLPPDSVPEDFPRFIQGAIYIIIDPKSSIYQYRLHKTTLSRVSPFFAKSLQMTGPKEAMETLKVAVTDAQARFELHYSPQYGKWILRRAIISPLVLKHTVKLGLDDDEIIANTPAVLSSAILADQINIVDGIKDGNLKPSEGMATQTTIIDGTKDGDRSSAENVVDIAVFGLQVKESAIGPRTYPPSVERNEKPGMGDDSVFVKHEKGSQDSAVPLSVQLDVGAEMEKKKSTSVVVDRDQLAVEPAKSQDVKTQKIEEEDPIPVIYSSDHETRVSAATSEPETYRKQETTSPSFISTGMQGVAEDSLKSKDKPSIKTEEDKLAAITSPSTLYKTQLTAKMNVNQAISQQVITTPSKPAAGTGPPIELCEAYNSLFLIFYSKAPPISTTSISTALEQCEALISIAKPLGCVAVIRPYLANAIGRFGKSLYMAVMAEPFRWLEMSIILESAVVFKESMVHIVGTYLPGLDGQINLPADIPQFVYDLILYKVRQMDQLRMNVNERLFSSSIIIDSKIVTFSFVDTAIFSTWLVVQIWRDWFCRQVAGIHLKPHITGRLYRTLAQSGDAYLTTASVKTLIDRIRDPVKVDVEELKEDLALLKEFAQEAVKKLCENNSMLDVLEAGIDYLTCTRIMDEELPWFETEQ